MKDSDKSSSIFLVGGKGKEKEEQEQEIPDALLVVIASYLDGKDLLNFELVSKRIYKLGTLFFDPLWEHLCHKRWKDWPRYRWINLQKSHRHLTLSSKSWKYRYIWVEKDYARRTISIEELETRMWYFNFTPEAGGRGSETLRKCFFHGGHMYVPDFMPLRYHLQRNNDDKNDHTVQMLWIENFPPHIIERLPNGEWIIKNQNVICVSCHETERLTYTLRGFQG